MRWHLDDKNWPKEKPPSGKANLKVKCLAGAATFVAAPSTERVEADSTVGQ